MNLKFPISNAPGRAVSPSAFAARQSAATARRRLTAARSQTGDGAQGTPMDRERAARPAIALRTPQSAIRNCVAFTLIEILVVVVLMSLIVLALMAVFSSTQAAFRASITQTDVLEGGRSAMGLIKSDFEEMAPSFGVSNGAVNFCAMTNQYQYQRQSGPLVQSLAGSVTQRTNVLENFFILTRQNTTWTGVGYAVDTTSTNYFNPLYRFSITTNAMARNVPAVLYTNFLNAILNASFNNMSHLMDGVVHLTVRAYDLNGIWMTNGYASLTNLTVKNVQFQPSTLGEVGFYMFSNTLPASVEIQLGLIEDRTLQRAESLPNVAPVWASSNYLAQHAGQVRLFRQRIPIRNVVPSAYQ
jgi:type II secretory pathway pseudopilin PulG